MNEPKEEDIWDQMRDDPSIPFEQRERKEWAERDPLTGGTMTVITIGKGFMMQIPHEAIKMSPEAIDRNKKINELYGEHRWEGNTLIWEVKNKEK